MFQNRCALLLLLSLPKCLGIVPLECICKNYCARFKLPLIKILNTGTIFKTRYVKKLSLLNFYCLLQSMVNKYIVWIKLGVNINEL